MERRREKLVEETVIKDVRSGVVHHVTMFVIGCAIGAVLTMLYTSFLPSSQDNRMSQHRRIMTRGAKSGVQDFGIFSDLRIPGNEDDNSRLKRSVALPVKPPTTNKPPGTTAHTTTPKPTTKTTPGEAKLTTQGPPTPNATSTTTPDYKNATNLCPLTDLKIKTYCQIPFQLEQLGIKDIVLRDVISSVYSSKVMDVWQKCPAGRWCLQPESQWEAVTLMAERWGNGNYQTQICPLLDCLTKLPKVAYCENRKRDLVVDTVAMLCSLPMTRETQLRDITCVKRILMMTHRDMSDLSRLNTTVARTMCSRNDSSCNEACTPLLTEFADVDLACDSYRYYVRNFEPWKWYYHSQLEKNCDVQPSLNRSFSFAFIGKYRNQILILVSLLTIVLLIGITVSSIIFWRRRRVVYKRAPETEGEWAEMEGLLVT